MENDKNATKSEIKAGKIKQVKKNEIVCWS